MSHAVRRSAALLVLGLVLTSLPARVWLFGACPVCGGFHEPVLLADLGPDPAPPDHPPDDPPQHHHDEPGCCPPLPYGPTPAGVPAAVLPAVGELRPESDPVAAPVPLASLIRPPRV
jgi:hypothetical protein